MNWNDLRWKYRLFAAGVLLVGGSLAVCVVGNLRAGILTACLGVMLSLIYFLDLRRRSKRLQELNRYLALVCAGKYELEVAENTEGELSILQNNLYKVIVLLQTQNERLKKDKMFLRDSLADISHQLKTPLTSMTVMMDLLKEEKNPERQREFIGIMEGQQEKMNWLVSTLLKLSRLDAGTVAFHLESLPLRELLSESIKPFLLTMDLQNIRCVMEMEDAMVTVDRVWSGEGFGNIIKNCVEHMENGGTLSFRTFSSTLYDAVLIKDDGCGIAREDLPHIFERFYRGYGAGTNSVGIGLALAKTIFEREHGEVFVKSEPGKGTEFEVRFYKVLV